MVPISHNELGVSEVRAQRGFGRSEAQPDTHLLDESARTKERSDAELVSKASKGRMMGSYFSSKFECFYECL